MSYTVFTGCSYTEGVGIEDKESHLWVNQVYRAIPALKETQLLNAAEAGSNNTDIFTKTIDTIASGDCKFLFVAWTELLRFKVNPGIERYSTSIHFGYNSEIYDVGLNNGTTYTAEYIKNIKNRFFDLCCPHYNIVEIIRYTKILQKMCNHLGIKVFFINSLGEWDKDYFIQITDPTRAPSDTTKYTQKLLGADTRDDDEYFELYDKIHQEYHGVLDCNWLNLHRSFRKSFYLDQGTDNLHPGINSNLAFSTFLIEQINKQNIL